MKKKLTIIVSGHLVEATSTDYHPSSYRVQPMSEAEKEHKRKIAKQIRLGEIPVNKESIAPSIRRARAKIKRLVYANAYQWKRANGKAHLPCFLTLTFKENITDLKTANRIFSKFIQRFNTEFSDELTEPIKYICVPEFQKRGAIHYHLILFNFPFVEKAYSRIRKTWNQGMIHHKPFNKKQSVDGVIGYIIKYIQKENLNPKLFRKRRYFVSRHLIQPRVFEDLDRERFIGIHKMRNTIQIFLTDSWSFDNKYVKTKGEEYRIPKYYDLEGLIDTCFSQNTLANQAQ